MKKNRIIYIFFSMLLFSSFMLNVNAIDSSYFEEFNFCAKSGIVKSFQILGYCLLIIKIIVPLLLIILGCVDLGKAVISSDDKAISNSISLLVKRSIAGVIIFFIPAIISFAISLVNGSSDLNEFQDCSKCISDPTNCVIPSDGGVFDPVNTGS